VVALAGAGGKTSLAWLLATRLARTGARVAVTTTTRMRVGEEPEGTRVVARDAPELDAVLSSGRPPLVTSGRTDAGKHLGIPAGEADLLSERVDHLIVEADGARGRLLTTGTPVVPGCTTHLVTLVGLGVLDRAAGPHIVFDPAGRIPTGTILDAATIRALLAPPAGSFLAVNGDDLARAAQLADSLWSPDLAGALAANTRTGELERVSNAEHRVAGIVLGAGTSSRFGSPKLLAEVDGIPLVRRAVDAARGAGLAPVCLVTGADADRVRAAAGDPPPTVVHNPDPASGMAASLGIGLRAVRMQSDAVMILLADMPGVDASLATRVLETYRRSACRVAAPLLAERTGHPAILRHDLFDRIDRLEGDAGARSIIRDNLDRAATVPLSDPRSQRDVDTPADLERFSPRGQS
jgi:probable selenium-dependent hydroxylase accessory protein YqeC